ncbi:MAG: hypothetical protein MJ151_04220, partial [Lachnospiraceae bacterium]|nr:hypothetical protein [Lachnospiraceae bacterium]
MIYKNGKKVSTDSIIYLTVKASESIAFTYWGYDGIAAYNSEPSYLPHQVFKVDKKHSDNDEVVYKKGTGSHVELHVGSDYYTLIYANRMDDVILATQYIAKNVYTTTDRVVIPEIDPILQNWRGPNPDIDTKLEAWSCGRTVDIKMTGDREVYMSQHTHTDGSVYMSAFSENDLVHGYQKSFVLKNDIILTAPITITEGLSICLNGYTLYYSGDRAVFDIKNGENVKICDCLTNEAKGCERGILAKASASIATTNFAMAIVERGTLEFENIKANGMATFAEIDGKTQVTYKEKMKFVRVLGTSSLLINNVEIKGYDTDEAIIYFNSKGKATIAEITFEHNRSDSLGGLIQLLDGDVVMYGTSSISHNEDTREYSEG